MYPHKDLCQTTNKGAQTSAQYAANSLPAGSVTENHFIFRTSGQADIHNPLRYLLITEI